MKVSVRFEGGQELAEALAGLSTRLSRKVMREVLVEAAEPIRKAAASMAPQGPDAPHIKQNIIISVAKSSVYLDLKSEVAAVAIGPKGGKEGFGYGLPQEIGTIDHAAQPFMRPALDSASGQALKIAGDAAWRELAGRGINRPTSVADAVVEGEV
jgi:HK97 gp10 family phage protein